VVAVVAPRGILDSLLGAEPLTRVELVALVLLLVFQVVVVVVVPTRPAVMLSRP
jgi:hypothetical protein